MYPEKLTIDPKEFVTISSHINNEQQKHPEATGALTSVLQDLSTVAKNVSTIISKAGLLGVHGETGATNVQGERVLRLDELANTAFKDILSENPHVAGFASEEEENFILFKDGSDRKYIIWFDPLDGSSNFATNVSIGSIFAIYEKTADGTLTEEDFLQEGRNQVCAGYFLYGTSTMFVYTTGNGVCAFTLDPETGKFLIPKDYKSISIPTEGGYYSGNGANYYKWPEEIQNYVIKLIRRGLSSRYIGSLVADIHRTLLKGGVFIYPSDEKHKNGKLRLCCELSPMAMIVECAGGIAVDEKGRRILDLKPEELHQRSSVIIGSKEDVQVYLDLINLEKH